jgi:hypothetical protein
MPAYHRYLGATSGGLSLGDPARDELIVARRVRTLIQADITLAGLTRVVPGLLARQKLGEAVRAIAVRGDAPVALPAMLRRTVTAVELVARERAKRLPAGPGGEPRFSRHGSLVMDWVEVFALVVFEPYRPRAWPASGSLLLDDLPFRVRDPQTGRTRIAFRIFAAMGDEHGRAKLWRVEARTSKSQPDWEAFLGALNGAPARLVCDNDHGLTGAVRARFPDAELYLCEWHLRHALERLMGKLHSEQPEHQEAIHALLADVEAAFTGPSFWAPFTERCHAAGIPRLSEWLSSTGQIVAEQFSRRGPRWKRPADTPLSTAPLDRFINPIRASIKPRAYGLKNRERTNRMLMLMLLLHANRQDDENDYVRCIRKCSRPTLALPASRVARSSMPAGQRRCADSPNAQHRIHVSILNSDCTRRCVRGGRVYLPSLALRHDCGYVAKRSPIPVTRGDRASNPQKLPASVSERASYRRAVVRRVAVIV